MGAPAARVSELSQRWAQAGHDVTVLTGPSVREDPDYPHFADYRIADETFRQFLSSWV